MGPTLAEQWLWIEKFFVFGLIFALGYDIIKMYRCLFGLETYRKPSKGWAARLPSVRIRSSKTVRLILSAIVDVLFSVAAALAFIIYLYDVNRCRFRWYLLLSAAAGFALYEMTVSRPVLFLAETLIGAVHLVLCAILRRLRAVLARLSRRLAALAVWLWRHTVWALVSAIGQHRDEARTRTCQKSLPLLMRVPEEMR